MMSWNPKNYQDAYESNVFSKSKKPMRTDPWWLYCMAYQDVLFSCLTRLVITTTA